MPHDHAGHGHHHHHIDPQAGDTKVALAIAVNLLLTIVQIVGGIFAGSLALIADAIHNLSDAVALVIAFAARKIARRPRDSDMSFGYARAELIAAFVNFITLIVISLYLLWEGAARLFNPAEVEGWIVVWIAGVALLVDVITALLTFRLSKESLNIRAAFLHNVADALSSVAVIVGGVLILLYDWRLVDPIITIGIALYILWHASRDLRPVVRILMNGAPAGLDMAAVQADMAAVEGVSGIHHVHLWQMDERRSSLEAHVVLAEDQPAAPVLRAIKSLLATRHAISHSTLEVEREGAGCAVPEGDHPAHPA